MRGRLPVGPEYVDQLQGSSTAKERVKAVLKTMTGDYRLQDACRELNVCEQRFHQLRQEAIAAALTALEPGLPGRPAHNPAPAEEEIRLLKAELASLKVELQAAKAREEIALIMPRVLREQNTPEKKTRRRLRKHPRPPPPGPRTST